MFQRIMVSVVLLGGLFLALQAVGKDASRQEHKLAASTTP
jgi:hypothetical protein